MELLAGKYLSHFYKPQEASRSLREHLESVVHTLVWVATIDAFQHWLYEHPGHTPLQRKQAWYGCYQQFSGQCIDWTGLNDVRDFLWHRQLHVFEVPFYYIEYGIAQLGALQLWLLSRKNQQKALALYKEALALGGSRPLGDLFKAAGISFDFSTAMIAPLMVMLEEEWQNSL
jgi:oligoendopeptidase F